MTQPNTIGGLRDTDYRPKTVKEELRGNLIAALGVKKPIFGGIVGYDATVIPQIENAVLSGQDIILLGERGQAKTRIARQLIELLDAAVPATHRGIFALNEPTDRAERVQVGLLNVMEERDVQIRGYKVRLPLDLFVVASANPEDYTNRGRIITPLKDRFGSQIRTHYPKEIATEVGIMEQERQSYVDEGITTTVPGYMKEVLAEISQLARRSPEISQRSGVSVRVTVANYENLVSAALKRALRSGETSVVPRISDLPAVVASTAGKIELESVGEISEERVIDRLVQRAVLNVFNRTFS